MNQNEDVMLGELLDQVMPEHDTTYSGDQAEVIPEFLEKPDLKFYDPFKLPEPDIRLYNEEDRTRSVISKLKPLTSPVDVRRISIDQIMMVIGESTTLHKIEKYGSERVCQLLLKDIGEYTLVSIEGAFATGSYRSSSAQTPVLCFATRELAEQFKQDLMSAYTSSDISDLPWNENEGGLLNPPSPLKPACKKFKRVAGVIGKVMLVGLGLFAATFIVVSAYELVGHAFKLMGMAS